MLNILQLHEEVGVPEGFRFPIGFSLLSSKPDIGDWYVIDDPKIIKIWKEILREQFPSRTLIPFVRPGAGDDVICFDGSDFSGDPRVLMIHSYCKPGWELRDEWRSFDDWLNQMQLEAKELNELEEEREKNTKSDYDKFWS